jgi:hypothetical protein
MQQQTAVEFLSNEIKSARKLCDDLNMEMDIFHTLDVLIKISEQAKEKEKEQHGQTWDSALKAGEDRAWNVMRAYSDFDDYYEETYKNK